MRAPRTRRVETTGVQAGGRLVVGLEGAHSDSSLPRPYPRVVSSLRNQGAGYGDVASLLLASPSCPGGGE